MDAMPPCGLQALGHQGRHDSHRHSLCECLWCEHHFPHLEEGQSKVHFNSEHQSPRHTLLVLQQSLLPSV